MKKMGKSDPEESFKMFRIDPAFWDKLGVDTSYLRMLDVSSRREDPRNTIVEKGMVST